MTPEERTALTAAFSGFHQDFDIDDVTEREILEWHARGLPASKREDFYSALDALLAESASDAEFSNACWEAGAHFTPARAELESFVVWARTPEGAAKIEAPGPISTCVVVQAKIDLS